MPLPAWLTRCSPMMKLAVWALAVVVIVAVLQGAALLAGLDFSLADKNQGGAAVVVIALAVLLGMMTVESRPLADYGLGVGPDWRRRALVGLACGAGFYAGYLLLLGAIGVLGFNWQAATPARWGKAALAVFSAGPMAVTQQIIFSGYLLTTLRDKHSRLTATVLPALLLALATAAGGAGGPLGGEGLRLLIGMTLVGALLGALRLRTGNIVLPAGVLAGCIAVRKFSSKLRLLEVDWDHPATGWLAPAGDPRQAPVFWCLVGAACVAAGVALWRYGETQPTSDAGVDAGFKRVMPFSNLLGLAPLDCWIRQLRASRFRIGLAYLPRLVMSLIGSAIMTLLALPERFIAPLLLRRKPPAPVFIVGMHRSGTTHLHNLLALDPQFRSPKNCEVFNPHGFLTGWLTNVLLIPLMTWRRPMDSVQMTPFSSQEEEFALAAMGAPSPYWSFCFPREIARHDRCLRPEGFSPAERKRWTRAYGLLLGKLTFWRRKTPLLKNPANTGRVAMLREAFPEARFIHIVRDPHAVWRSNQRLAEQGLVVFQLQDPDPADNHATRCLTNYRQMIDAYYRDTHDLPRGQSAELRFEDLEADPLGQVQALYALLGMEYTAEYDRRLRRYLESISGYRKNRFSPLSPLDSERISRAMGPYLERWGYADQPASAPKAA